MTQPGERLMKHQMSKLPHETPFLHKRDACSDAFGSDWSDDVCWPSDTLCCLHSEDDFPSCEVHIDKGWCCVGNSSTDNCYVDQPSECDTPNSVPCTHLAEGPDTLPNIIPLLNTIRCSINNIFPNLDVDNVVGELGFDFNKLDNWFIVNPRSHGDNELGGSFSTCST
ncbi:hypothetical protein F4678DRAFT_465293 [Xylaria arbuscula]|nr:hypothetical protein F4678DRAFT_465293 [Xylaria arbuscula]